MTTKPLPPPGPHGGDGPSIAAALGVSPSEVLDLSATLNPFAPDVAALVRRHADSVIHYGDPGVGERQLAGRMGVDPSCLVLTNGASEGIALVAATQPLGRVDEPEFSLYRRHLTLDPTGPRWRSNPNNPLGTLAHPDDLAGVWDESFWPLSTGTWTRGDAEAGAIVIGSLTKLYACPGLRLGYVIAPSPEVAERLRDQRPQWSVSALALAVLPDLLGVTDLTGWAAQICRARAELASVLTRRGLQVRPSEAPWILVTEAPDLRTRLAAEGIAVRDCASFGLEGTMRIAVPRPSELDRLGRALDGISPR